MSLGWRLLTAGVYGGKEKKTDWGAMYPDPPVMRLDDYDLWLKQIDDLIGQYDSIKTGDNQFDAVKFMYEPQKAELNRLYGIDTLPGDTAGAKGGTLQQLQNNLNKRGLLDSGTSGLLESQVYADRNRQLADLFGTAKQTQRNDYFNALTKLNELYPERFEVRNIPNNLDYFNNVNKYNVDLQRNGATEASRLMSLAAENQMWANIMGNIGGKVGDISSSINQSRADKYSNMAGQPNNDGFNIQNIEWSKLFGGNNNNNGGNGNANIQMPYSTNGYSSGINFLSEAERNRQNQLNSGVNAPSTSQNTSLVNQNAPGMNVNGGNNFLVKLLQSLAQGGPMLASGGM